MLKYKIPQIVTLTLYLSYHMPIIQLIYTALSRVMIFIIQIFTISPDIYKLKKNFILFRLLPSLFPACSLVFIRHIARYTPQTTAKQL